MTIRTHKMIADAGESDSGKLTAQTSVAAATKIYLPCNEGSGATVSDNAKTTGLVFNNADLNTTVTWGGAANSGVLGHFVSNTVEVAPVTGSVVGASPLSKSFLIWHHATPAVLANSYQLILGDNSGGVGCIRMNNTAWRIYDDSTNLVDLTPTDPVVGEIFMGALFLDRDNSLAYAFTSSNGATITQDGVGVDASAIVDDITFSNELAVNAFAGIDTYGSGIYAFSNTPSLSEVLTNLELIRQAQLTTNKVLPIDWLTEV